MKELIEIQNALKVNKDRKNSFGNYNYRSCEDIMEAVKPLLPTDCSLTLSDEVVLIGDRYYVKAKALIMNYKNGMGSTCYGWAREAEIKKGMDAAQITGAASSYARKYALCGLFLIDDSNDPDSMDNRAETAKPKKETKAKPAEKEKPKKESTEDPIEVIDTFFNNLEGKPKPYQPQIQKLNGWLYDFKYVDRAHNDNVFKYYNEQHDQFWQKQEAKGN